MAIFENKDDIYELMDKFEKSSLSEFEIALGTGFNLKLSKYNKYNGGAVIQEIKSTPVISEIKYEKTSDTSVAAESPVITESSDDIKIIKAPLVGTFYSSASPTSGAYVKVGDKITKGMVICIIEAMKSMNEIESDMDGEVVEILANNGNPVEYGQTLFRLR